MKTLTLFISLLVLAPMAAGADISAYDLKLRTFADGSARANVTVTMDGATAGRISVPVGFAGIRDLTFGNGPAGTILSSSPVNGQTTVHIVLPDGVPARLTVSFSFGVPSAFQDTPVGPGERRTLPAGSRLFRHTLVNTEMLTLAAYRMEVSFPAGTRAQAVREWAPKLRKGEAGPRVKLGALPDGPGASLRVDRLKQGDTASMLIELVPASRSYGWLIAGVLLSVLYLVYFRDLVVTRADH